jgi:hypothetical protein
MSCICKSMFGPSCTAIGCHCIDPNALLLAVCCAGQLRA